MNSDAEQLLTELKVLLPLAKDLGYDDESAANDIYEGWVFGLVVTAARRAGWDLYFENASSNSYRFPAGPSSINSDKGFTYCRLEWRLPSGPWIADLEVHIGIKVAGHSSISHEFDVVVIEKSQADWARQHNRDPQFPAVIMQFECKLHSSNVGLPTVRSCVGLAIECRLFGKSALVTRRATSDNGGQLLRAYDILHLKEMMPTAPDVTKLRNFVRLSLEAHLADLSKRMLLDR